MSKFMLKIRFEINFFHFYYNYHHCHTRTRIDLRKIPLFEPLFYRINSIRIIHACYIRRIWYTVFRKSQEKNFVFPAKLIFLCVFGVSQTIHFTFVRLIPFVRRCCFFFYFVFISFVTGCRIWYTTNITCFAMLWLYHSIVITMYRNAMQMKEFTLPNTKKS